MPRTTTRVDLDALLVRLAVPRATDDVDGRILDAAAEALVAHGLAGFEVDDVVERSGVGRSTVYRRFVDRNGLIAAALAHEGRRFFAALADAVSDIDDVEDQVVAAFSAGLRLAHHGGFAALLRNESLALQLLTVDGAPIVAAAREQLVAEAARRDPDVDPVAAGRSAELLVRLAISFVLQPRSALDLADPDLEDTVRRHVVPLLAR